jgi:hypothetical protein
LPSADGPMLYQDWGDAVSVENTASETIRKRRLFQKAIKRFPRQMELNVSAANRDVAFMTVMRFFIVCSFKLGANAPCFLMMLIRWELTFWRQQFPSSYFNAKFPR